VSKSYAWHCHVCDALNEAERGFCIECGYPKTMSAMEIDAARVARGEGESPSLPAPMRSSEFWTALEKLPAWRQVLAVVGHFSIGCGCFIAVFAWSLSGFAFACIAAIAGFLLKSLAFAGRD
jgi:hypothetical protein